MALRHIPDPCPVKDTMARSDWFGVVIKDSIQFLQPSFYVGSTMCKYMIIHLYFNFDKVADFHFARLCGDRHSWGMWGRQNLNFDYFDNFRSLWHV